MIIKNADGIIGDAYLKRVDVVRTKLDFTKKLIKLDLQEVLDGNPEIDINLQSLDKVRVYSLSEMVKILMHQLQGI